MSTAPHPLLSPARQADTPLEAMLRRPLRDACCTPAPHLSDSAYRPRRATLADLDLHQHCSIIGTCLTTGELRRLVTKCAPQVDRHGASDLEIHHAGVEMSCAAGPGRKEINKALDTRHALVIKQFKPAPDAAAVKALWQKALASGEVPGAYWALMTHPAATPELRALAFGDVHMLSHLVGAANRADIRRLVALEAECAALREQNERQQGRLRELGTQHADVVHGLEEQVRALTQRCRQQAADGYATGETAQLRAALAERDGRLALHAERHDVAERRHAAAAMAAHVLQGRVEQLENDADAAGMEAAALEQALAAALEGDRPQAVLPRLDGVCIAYIGGRPGAVTALTRLVEQAGGELLAHDGGIEERRGTLAGVLARARVVVFPVDCISHHAMHTVKRVCEQTGAAWHPLRSASVAGCMLLLRRLYGGSQHAAVVPASHFCLRHG